MAMALALKLCGPDTHLDTPMDRLSSRSWFLALSGLLVLSGCTSGGVDKFLLGKTTTNTAIAKTPYNTDLTKWITWTTPQLK
jgi:hypothetical protein